MREPENVLDYRCPGGHHCWENPVHNTCEKCCRCFSPEKRPPAPQQEGQKDLFE